jgi:hypothetical protein
MRINVYSQELTDEIGTVSKTGTGKDGQEETFHGVRLMLVSPDALHHTLDDDDRSAITLWLPKSESRRLGLASALHGLGDLVSGLTLGEQ